MELREYWAIARKWWWLLLLCTLLGGGAAYVVSIRMDPTYEASTLLMIGGSLEVVNPTTGEMMTSEKLAQTYAELVKARPILEATMLALDLPEEPRVSVSLLRNTQLMRITVEDSLPQRAAATADELARQLILQSPSAPEREEKAYRSFVSEQLRDLEAEIATLSKAVMTAKEAAGPDEVVRLQRELNVRRDNYSSMLSFMKRSSINYIGVIDTAKVPIVPTKPKVMQNTMLAAVVGLMLAGGAAFLIEYLDESIKDQRDIEQTLGLPALGSIAEISSDAMEAETISYDHPKSAFAEAYRILRTNVRYSLPAGTKRRVFLVTSVGPGEGKSTTASNLAIVTARAGQRTILLDADLRRPSMHEVWEYSNDVGLSSLLVGEVESLDSVLRPTDVDGLWILPSGPIPPNAAELLGSPRMVELFEELSQRADVVILDSPPLFAVADASILASMVTGTLLVVEAGRTSMQGCAQAVETIKKVSGNLLGVVVNRLQLRRRGYGGYYHYYHGYYNYSSYYGSDGDGQEGRRKKRRRRKSKAESPESDT